MVSLSEFTRLWYNYAGMTLAERAAAKLMGCGDVYYDFDMRVWHCSCGWTRKQAELPEVIEWRDFHACPSNR